MAITTTPLGFQKPDGNELLRNGDNVIAANAQTAEGLHQAVQSRLYATEAVANSAATQAATNGAQLASNTTRLTSVESKNTAQDIRISSVESAAFVNGGLLAEDPSDPGFYAVTTSGYLQNDPSDPGFYIVGA